MIKKPSTIVFKSIAIVCLLGMILQMAHYTLVTAGDNARYNSIEGRLLRLEELSDRGDFDRIRDNLSYYEKSYDEAYDPMWEITEAYNAVCDYQIYAYGLEHPSEATDNEAWRSYAVDMQWQCREKIKAISEVSTFSENAKVLQYFLDETEAR